MSDAAKAGNDARMVAPSMINMPASKNLPVVLKFIFMTSLTELSVLTMMMVFKFLCPGKHGNSFISFVPKSKKFEPGDYLVFVSN